MVSENNVYFEEMRDVVRMWETARKERNVRRMRVIDELGEDCDELKALDAEEKAARFPYEEGAVKAYDAWMDSITRKTDEIEMSNFLWENETADFVETFRKAGIRTFIYTDNGSAVKENLRGFAAAGCTIGGPCVILRRRNLLGDEKVKEVRGIQIRLN